MRENHRGSTNGRVSHQEAGYISATQMSLMRDLFLQWHEIPYTSLHYRVSTIYEYSGRYNSRDLDTFDQMKSAVAETLQNRLEYTELVAVVMGECFRLNSIPYADDRMNITKDKIALSARICRLDLSRPFIQYQKQLQLALHVVHSLVVPWSLNLSEICKEAYS